MNSDVTVYTIAGSCSDAVVALCAHLGLNVDVRERKLHAEALARVNPDRGVPTLVTGDGFILTETMAILKHLARLHAAELLGRGPVERARNEELSSYLATTVYNAFLMRFRPDRSADSEDGRAAVREKSGPAIEAVLDRLETRLSATTFAMGERLTTSDFFLVVFCNWAQAIDAALLQRRPALRAHHARMRAMPFNADRLDAHVA